MMMKEGKTGKEDLAMMMYENVSVVDSVSLVLTGSNFCRNL